MSQEVDDFLAHFGKKGMKWGSRNERNAAITDARRRQQIRTDNFYKADEKVWMAKTAKGKAAAEKMVEKAAKDLINNPDAEVAKLLTTGEKFALAVGIAGAAVAVGSMVTAKRIV